MGTSRRRGFDLWLPQLGGGHPRTCSLDESAEISGEDAAESRNDIIRRETAEETRDLRRGCKLIRGGRRSKGARIGWAATSPDDLTS